MHDLRTETFPELYEQWARRQITQAYAAGVLGMSERTFRRYVAKYRKFGPNGLMDRRAMGCRSAPPVEVTALAKLYAEGQPGWSSVRGFYRVYRDSHGGSRSYTWVKNRLQEAGLVTPRRSNRSTGESDDRQPAEGLLLHQASSTSGWLPTRVWQLVLVVDDASRRVHSGVFARNDAIRARFRTVLETIVANGLFDAIHVDRALRSHHDCQDSGHFPLAMSHLGVSMIPSCSPEARNRYDRVFRVLHQCLPQHMADAGIQSRHEANEFLQSYWAKLNRFFVIQAEQSTASFAPLDPKYEVEVRRILCSHKPFEVDTDCRVHHPGKRASAQVACCPHADAGVHGVVHTNEDRRRS